MRKPSDPDPGDPEPPQASSLGVSTEEATAVTPPGKIKDAVVGSTWGHLRLLEELGRGAFGRVFRAWDNTLAREVALKILRLEAADEAALSAVLREGQMLARIRHRHVVTVFGAQQIDREVGVWMELVRGRTLSQMVREDGPLGPEEAAIVGMTLCDALAAVHSAGLLHRDIKAQNVMRESGGRIVLMDFGAGLELIERKRHPEVVGTPLYMSPAVLAGAAWSPSADLYSLGVLLFYLVSGRYPVEGNSMGEIATAHALGEQRALADVRPGLPEGFSRVVRRALGHRYRSAGAMMRDLAEAIPGHESSMPAADSPTEASPRTPMVVTPVQATPVAQPRATVPRSAYVAGTFVLVWGLGILSSAVFNHSLGRDPMFYARDETLLMDFVWGVRAIFPPILYMLMALIAVRVIGFLWQSAVRFLPPLTRFVLSVRRRWYGSLQRRGMSSDDARLGQWLLTAQVAALGVTIWAFWNYINAFGTFLDVAPPEAIAMLGPENHINVYYRGTLSVLVLMMLFAWWGVLNLATPTERVDKVTAIAGIGVIFLALALLVAPFRLEAQMFEVTTYKDQKCSLMGERANELQLFCMTMLPRARVVRADDPLVQRKGIRDLIFKP
jgi:tRNA A-37 threonylcarbamoyl transferase component Bud32